MAFSSHYVFLHYITLHYIYVTLHHVTSHYIYLYVFIFNLGAISFFHTKLIVQAYGQLGHRVQDSASTLDSLTSSEVDKVIAQLAIGHCQRRDSACFLGPYIGHNFGQGRVFRVRTKPSKQPLGLVARGVPIEKVWAKRAMHSDWGGPTLDPSGK